MSQENVEVVRRWFALLNAGDGALPDLFHPDVEWRDLMHAPDVAEALNGVESLGAMAQHWADAYDEFGAEVFEYIDAQPWVICDIRWYGKGKGSGVTVDVHSADAFEVKDGRIIRVFAGNQDVAAALKAVGLKE